MKAGVLLLLFLAQLHPSWPARESSWVRYQVFKALVYWDAGSRQLSVLQRILDSEEFVQVKWVTSAAVAPSFNEVFQVLPQALGNAEFELSATGQRMIGEIGRVDGGLVVAPPEPKLSVEPTSGVLTTMHQALDSRSGRLRTWPFLTKFATIGHFDRWGSFADVWWTSLEEADTDGGTLGVYNYVFAKGIGLVNFWFSAGRLVNNMAWGWEYWAVAWST